jgi:hypothetical protein
MSPNGVFPPHEEPQNVITKLVLEHPRVTYDVNDDTLVIALRDELLVRNQALVGAPALLKELSAIARRCGSLAERIKPGPPDDIEIWRLRSPQANAIDEARRLRVLAPDEYVKTRKGPALAVPAVSPNHVSVVSKYDCCPASPANPIPPPPLSGEFVEPLTDGPSAAVVVIDTGYIHTDPAHAALDARVSELAGEWLDTFPDPAVWRPNPSDTADANHDGVLDGVAGHGTFIAGLIAHRCRRAKIRVVGERHACVPIGNPANPVDERMLFVSEYDIATALLANAHADVVSCGFAFPTLDAKASNAFTSVMALLASDRAPRRGAAVVSPAGNESSSCPYWPAAHPDVVGVASTNRMENARAYFSNWGPWADCCARGQDVSSTFIYWRGPIDGEPLNDIDDFVGWARWSGTSFAAPKVTAAIARLVAEGAPNVLPVEAWEQLVSGNGGVTVAPMTDTTLNPAGVTLPHLSLG